MSVQLTYPGVYVQELPSGTSTISGVSTSVTAFIGFLSSGPIDTPVQLLNFGDFQSTFGGLDEASDTSFQVSQFFINGGTECWVSRCVDATDATQPPRGIDIAGDSSRRTGIFAFDAVQAVNLICAPDLRGMGTSDYLTSAVALLNYALTRRAFVILDPPATLDTVAAAQTWVSTTPPSFGPGIVSAAAYFPEVLIPDPFGAQPRRIGASGTLAGLYALTDVNSGVWKAPAGINTPLAGVESLSYTMTDAENGDLNTAGLNALRTFPVYGNLAWGARTLASANPADEDWKYINVRRLVLYVEQSLVQGLSWVAFEPNDQTLWTRIEAAVNAFLQPLYLQGALMGASASQAFQVTCNASTTTPADIENGIVNLVIEIAPARPAEFIVITLQLTAQSAS